jgi:Tfp pilus assembly protein PilX
MNPQHPPLIYQLREKVLMLITALMALAFMGLIVWSSFSNRSTPKEKAMEIKIEVARSRANAAFSEAEMLRQEANSKQARIDQLEKELHKNKLQTNEKTKRPAALPADSLGRFIAEQLDFLHKAWY